MKFIKVISSAEGHLKHHEKEMEETILEFLKPFTDGLKVHAASSRHSHSSLPHSRIHPRNMLCTSFSAVQRSGRSFFGERLGQGVCSFQIDRVVKTPSPRELFNVGSKSG